MSNNSWFVVGISGVTCSGKTSIANHLHKNLINSKLLSQDLYFLPEDNSQHVHIPELNHINWELITSLDMNKMENDIVTILSKNRLDSDSFSYSKSLSEKFNDFDEKDGIVELISEHLREKHLNVLLIEGFSIYEHPKIRELCHLKIFLTLPKNVCWERRNKRTYEPPDVPGYFEMIVWPQYEIYRDHILNKYSDELIVFDGTLNLEKIIKKALLYLNIACNEIKTNKQF